GNKAFPGASHASVISAIMSSDPPSLCSLQPMTPPALDRIVKRCLAKDPDERWQTARDLEYELKWVRESVLQHENSPSPNIRRTKHWGVGVAVGITELIVGLSIGTFSIRLRNRS